MFKYSRKQNVSIPPDQNMSQGAKCFTIPTQYTTEVVIVPSNKELFEQCFQVSQLPKYDGNIVIT